MARPRWNRKKKKSADELTKDEYGIAMYCDGEPVTLRELCLGIAEARRHHGQDAPDCEHENVSKNIEHGERLCLVCGEYVPAN